MTISKITSEQFEEALAKLAELGDVEFLAKAFKESDNAGARERIEQALMKAIEVCAEDKRLGELEQLLEEKISEKINSKIKTVLAGKR